MRVGIMPFVLLVEESFEIRGTKSLAITGASSRKTTIKLRTLPDFSKSISPFTEKS
jgi:hypothetical protein